MSDSKVIVLLVLASIISTSFCQFQKYEVYYQWKQVDYNFADNMNSDELIEAGVYIQRNCVPTAMKVHKDDLFIVTPRYFPGVPSTLNVVPYKKSWFDKMMNRNDGPTLNPFPSWEMQEVGNCSALQSVQVMELDPYNRLWILDTGRVDALTPLPRNLCPAKMVIVDLADGNRIERVHEFPNTVVPGDTNGVKDFQIACTSRQDCRSYISNTNGTTSIVVYDYKNDDSWYATHPFMAPELDKADITIEGITATIPLGIAGLGLTPKSTGYSHLFFSKVAGDHIYMLPTAAVNDGAALKVNPNLADEIIRDLGQKPTGQADGTAMDNRGRWYFGSLPQSAVYYIDTKGVLDGGDDTVPLHYHPVIGDNKTMQWPDIFSFDGAGYLLVSTTRFQLVANFLINPLEVNYRLIKFKTRSLTYFEDYNS